MEFSRMREVILLTEKRCNYRGKEYSCKIKKGMVNIFSRNEEDGFIPCKDLLGNVIKGCFYKNVKINDVDEIYNLRYVAAYGEREFEILSLNSNVIKTHKLTLVTQDEVLAQKLGFEKREQFLFFKDIDATEKTKIICYIEYLNKEKETDRKEILLEDLKTNSENKV